MPYLQAIDVGRRYKTLGQRKRLDNISQYIGQYELYIHTNVPLKLITGEIEKVSGECCTHDGLVSQLSNPELKKPHF